MIINFMKRMEKKWFYFVQRERELISLLPWHLNVLQLVSCYMIVNMCGIHTESIAKDGFSFFLHLLSHFDRAANAIDAELSTI